MWLPTGALRPTRPEHTLAAYDLALKEGADGVECDVRLTRDGHLVCVHDRRLDRTSTGAGLVSTMTLAQLRELEYGAWHDSWRPDGTHGDTSLLTLDALVALVLDWHRPVKIFIETKHPVRYGSLVESKLLALLHRFGIAAPASADRSRAVVMSFSAAAVWRIRRAAPMLPTVLLGKTGPLPGQQCGHRRRCHRRRAVDSPALREYPQLVDRAAAQGRAVYCWTVDHYEDIDFCRDIGVAWVATNHPGRTKAWLENGRAPTGAATGRLRTSRQSAAGGAGRGNPLGAAPTSRATKFSRSNRLAPARSATRSRVLINATSSICSLQEPLHELLAEVVPLVAGRRRHPPDLLGDSTLLVESERQGIAGPVELVAHRVGSRNLHVDTPVDQMLHQHHRVIAFLDCLAVKMLRQLR